MAFSLGIVKRKTTEDWRMGRNSEREGEETYDSLPSSEVELWSFSASGAGTAGTFVYPVPCHRPYLPQQQTQDSLVFSMVHSHGYKRAVLGWDSVVPSRALHVPSGLFPQHKPASYCQGA